VPASTEGLIDHETELYTQSTCPHCHFG